MNRAERRNFARAMLFVAPWVVGFLFLNLYPFLASVWYSLCDYSALSVPVFLGFQNYADLFRDPVFWKALSNTVLFALFAIPLGTALSIGLAVLLNQPVPGQGLFRTIFFLPSLVPAISLAILWQWMLNGPVGLVNMAVRPFLQAINAVAGTSLQAPDWLNDPNWALWGLVLTGLWGTGHAVVIYLAGLQEIPVELYEAAELMLSPVIFFNVLMGIIGALQTFAVPYILTGGADGPGRSLLFLATYIYQHAFDYWNMGYASALALILFLVIVVLSFLAVKLGEKKVHYGGR
ncbi:MAG: sugar ABC transporter permease [Verrucomicrobia bacterium]|nr:sugar ABC transporter permease [Verrucomicrobiota bacterium]